MFLFLYILFDFATRDREIFFYSICLYMHFHINYYMNKTLFSNFDYFYCEVHHRSILLEDVNIHIEESCTLIPLMFKDNLRLKHRKQWLPPTIVEQMGDKIYVAPYKEPVIDQNQIMPGDKILNRLPKKEKSE